MIFATTTPPDPADRENAWREKFRRLPEIDRAKHHRFAFAWSRFLVWRFL